LPKHSVSPDVSFTCNSFSVGRWEQGMKGICLSNVLSDLTIENLAISGSDSQAHIVTIEERLELQPTDVFGLVVMTSGGNDLIHSYGRSPARECAMYGATLEQAKPWIAAFKTAQRQMMCAS